MKLFKVKITYETVILAKSQAEAEQDAPYIVRYDASDDIASVSSEEVKSLSDLPRGWGDRCRPWGERDPLDRTIGQLLS